MIKVKVRVLQHGMYLYAINYDILGFPDSGYYHTVEGK